MSRRGTLSSAGSILAKVMNDRGLGSGSAVAKLQQCWDKAVGAGIASHARPEMLKGEKLTVVVDNSAWMTQLSMLSPGIIEQVNRTLGEGAVTELKFRLGKPEKPSASGKRERFVPKRREPLPEEEAGMAESLAGIKDRELREKAARLLRASVTRKRE